MSSLHSKLQAIQSDLKAPKGQKNTFGNYNYRSCEDILEAVKPLLQKQGLVLTISDDVVEVGGRIYVKATAIIGDGETQTSVSAFARESEDKKGMDAAQITGAASSYARKYALNGLFCIDDTKDADTRDNTAEKPKTREEVNKCSSGDVVRISTLAKDTQTDLLKLYQHFKITGTPTREQAAEMIVALEKKLNDQLNSVA